MRKPLSLHALCSATLILILCISINGCSSTKYEEGSPEAAAAALTQRLIPHKASMFLFKSIPPTPDGQDVFRIEALGNKILISGNSSNSMAKGLGHYLKYCCYATVGWFVYDEINLPRQLPLPDEPIEVHSRVKERFFLNYCTFGYTMPWWHWEEWEHFIDWMAVNGINLPLAITGQESIWYEVWTSLGLDGDRVREYFTGPAHLPWHRMLNIDRWGGPLPQSWLKGQADLQKKIVARERELGMKPVLPAFSGHVPDFLSEVYPDAKITKMGSWCGFPEEDVPSFLDPMDPLFTKIQGMFLDAEINRYGTDHIYGIDLFNEMTPPSDSPEYLGRVSRQVYESLHEADSEGVWLQMTWLFWNERNFWTNERVEPFITSYPKEKSLLLDYYCERQEVWQRTERYFGVPYIWCYLGNFGGNTYLDGNLAEINSRLENTFENGGDNFRGIGSTLEGFDCNPFVYQYVFEKAWDNPTHKDLDKYSALLSRCRTGVDSPKAEEAWDRLIDDIYVDRSVPGHSPAHNLRPSFGRSSSYHSSVKYSYKNSELKEIISLLLESEGKGSAYEFDLVNLTRQYLSNLFEEEFAIYKEAYTDGDWKKMEEQREKMEDIFTSLEKILSTQGYFLVGKWISDARGWGVDKAEKDFFERNARNLLTTWGDRGNLLTDYADRTWSGLLSSYYKGRWDMFFDAVQSAISAHGEFNSQDEAELKERTLDFEKNWWENMVGQYPSAPSGNSVKAVREVLESLD